MLPGAAVRVAEDWLVAGRTTRHLPICEDPGIAARRYPQCYSPHEQMSAFDGPGLCRSRGGMMQQTLQCEMSTFFATVCPGEMRDG